MTKISLLPLQNEIPSQSFAMVWAITGAELGRVAHMRGREQSENRDKQKLE